MFLTWTPAQVFDVNLLLLHTRRLSDQTRVVVGVPVGGTHRVFVVTAAVDVTYAPEERSRVSGWFSLGNECSVCSLEPERVSSALNH